jgi:hypothetical protein
MAVESVKAAPRRQQEPMREKREVELKSRQESETKEPKESKTAEEDPRRSIARA